MSLVSIQATPSFEEVFATHYSGLHGYAYVMLRDDDLAEETVQQVFYQFYVKKAGKQVLPSTKAYLYKSVYNACMNQLKHYKHRLRYQHHIQRRPMSYDESDKQLANKELEEKLANAINQLPQQRRTIFQLSRYEELKNREIAEIMGLSIKTIEAEITKTLQTLRKELADFLP